MGSMFSNDSRQFKFDVLTELAAEAYQGEVDEAKVQLMAKNMVSLDGPRFRCCVYKEREVLRQRVRLACGEMADDAAEYNPHQIIQVIDAACDGCTIRKIRVTDNCRKCMGKTSPAKEHNCGACGYETCRLKAIAVLDGKADPKICLPEALEHAQSLSNVVIDNTPNGIIVLDEDDHVREMNPAARKMTALDMINPTGMEIDAVLPSPQLKDLIHATGEKTGYLRTYYDAYDKLIDQAVVKIGEENYTVIILMDRTEEESKAVMMKAMRAQTIDVTQKVIDDQMRTVQEIASLLGETTAKSKVALTELKKAMQDEDEREDTH